MAIYTHILKDDAHSTYLLYTIAAVSLHLLSYLVDSSFIYKLSTQTTGSTCLFLSDDRPHEIKT